MAASSVGVLRSRSSSSRPPPLPEFENFNKPSKVEVREDEEQERKFQEIIELLLAAGYFRARIKGLSPFDKVVGGMTWCIEVCNVDIDVDLLFQENLTIGQKISLTEKIVAVLPKMKCPHRIEPHQIQGLDFIHIFPVIQWLVKRAIETREETGDYIRAFSISQFHKSYETPEDIAAKILKEKMAVSYGEIKEVYRPQRLFRYHTPQKLKEEEVRVQTTLLEYGKKLGSARITESKEGETSSDTEKSVQKASEEESRIQNLMKSMSVTNEHESKLTASQVGSIVGLQSGEIQQVASEFAEKQAELASEEMGERGLSGIQYHKRTVASLTKQIKEKETKLEEVEDINSNLKTAYQDSQSRLNNLQNTYKDIMKEMKVLEEAENDDNKSLLETLRSLVATNETLKKQEQEFRNHCKEELARLKAQIEEVKASTDESSSEDQEYRETVEKQYNADKEKLQKIRMLLARKNREIATLQRKFDEVPSRAELSQYQKRFVELYNQVAAKHKETKQFYTLYNTLEDSRMYIMKEVDLLNSIQENFTEAMSSSASKGEFLTQLEKIVERILQNKAKVEKKKLDEKRQRDMLNDQLLDLIEKQRLYFKTVKDFKEECRKNEILVSKLKEKNKGR
ncbi:coiled-coil domain-containing protein 93 [Trichonephila inaurata madagascariensis]|uniref:Coiled-coil domain-containing protein 93 n=1 Tax=Trichonephila inaurata madagascariensis TaxID=2747483 RepID=A0A8X6XYR9_9ARAC|nr:coiled-coil domain-containing protein 93 [Trichonephila inaurata madagascariensis]